MKRAGLWAAAVAAVWMAACSGGDGGPVVDDTVGPDVPVAETADPGAEAAADTPAESRDEGVTPDVAGEEGSEPGAEATEGATELPPACAKGQPCDDDDPCTSGEACDDQGACVGGTKTTCGDGRDCTDDACDGKGGCLYTLKKDACLIDGLCHAAGDPDPLNPCVVCNPATSPTAWAPGEGTVACDPSAVLQTCEDAPSGTCNAGDCKPDLVVAKPCDDDNPCTDDACDATSGCTHVNRAEKAPCALADPCKPGTCVKGNCVVPADASCDDGNACTSDLCDAGGCHNVALNVGACDPKDACVVDASCQEGQCKGLAVNFDDGNVCTLDGCDKVTGIWHDIASNACCNGGVSLCDDGNVCTDDNCGTGTRACLNTPNQAGCDDNDPCTVNDTCSNKACHGTPRNCNDGNACTVDSCSGGKCLHTAALDGAGCDDGLACSTNDHCLSGQCVADMSGCQCTPNFSPAVSKVVSLGIAQTGFPGDGLDLDFNAATCSPGLDQTPPTCSGGIQNALGIIAGLSVATDGIKKALDGGSIMILFEHRDLKTDGTPYTLAIYVGKLDPSNPDCAFQTDTCAYDISRAMLDPNCKPLVTMTNAKIVGNKLTAGGPGAVFPFDLPFSGLNLHLDLYEATIEASVTVSGGKVTSMTGILGGAAPKQEIVDAVNAIPDAQIPPPATKDLILLVLGQVEVDIDGDGDGTKESSSIGLKFGAIGGQLVGAY